MLNNNQQGAIALYSGNTKLVDIILTAMNEVSLSAMIGSLKQSWDNTTFRQLLWKLRQTPVGVMVVNAHPEYMGETIRTEGDVFTLGSTTYGDGKSRVLAFADPQVFIARFGQQFNTEMTGEDVFRVVLHNPSCHGILLNSAQAEISLPIERRDVVEVMMPSSSIPTHPAKGKSSWWKWWN